MSRTPGGGQPRSGTKILCTLGPSSMRPEIIRELDERGVDLFRLNLSHTPLEELEGAIRFFQKHTDKPLCLDTDGAQVRTGVVRPGVHLVKGATVTLVGHEVTGSEVTLPLRPDVVVRGLKPGHLLSIDFHGALLRVTSVSGGRARAVVLEAGDVGSNRAVTVEPSPLLPALTEKDVASIKVGRQFGIAHVALSFARRADDVARLRRLAGVGSCVISKIESRAGVRNMDNVIAASDAVIIDRGDLSREIPLEHVPMHQKEIIRRSNSANTPVFVATNLLESMISNRRPTIAEANDIMNTLLDGAHGLVLAAETTVGEHPVATVEMVVRMIRAFEWSRNRRLTTQGPRLQDLAPREADAALQAGSVRG